MTSALTVTTFGGLVIQYNGEVVTDLSSRKAIALLVYLVAEKDRPLRRESLLPLLWPGMP